MEPDDRVSLLQRKMKIVTVIRSITVTTSDQIDAVRGMVKIVERPTVKIMQLLV